MASIRPARATRATPATRPSTSPDAVGALLAALGALAFAVTIICNRELAKHHLPVASALGIRFTVAAAVLVGVLAVRRLPLLPEKGERLRVIVLGGVGYMAESTLFYMGVERGTTAAVALLFYSYPSIVTLIELATARRLPDRRSVVALGLSAAGIVLVVAAGSKVDISAAGAALALGAAGSFSIYFIASDRLIRTSAPLTTSAWVAAGAAVSFLGRVAVAGGFDAPAGRWPLLITNGVATAVAFTAMFAALRRLGASRTAVVMTLEAFFAVVLAALLLHESLEPVQALGGIGILAAAVLVGRRRVAVVEA